MAKSTVHVRMAVAQGALVGIGLCGVCLPALLWLLVLCVPMVYLSNKSLSNQYFIHCLFRGHYNIMNRLRWVLRRPTLFHNRLRHAKVVIYAMVENELALSTVGGQNNKFA